MGEQKAMPSTHGQYKDTRRQTKYNKTTNDLLSNGNNTILDFVIFHIFIFYILYTKPFSLITEKNNLRTKLSITKSSYEIG